MRGHARPLAAPSGVSALYWWIDAWRLRGSLQCATEALPASFLMTLGMAIGLTPGVCVLLRRGVSVDMFIMSVMCVPAASVPYRDSREDKVV